MSPAVSEEFEMLFLVDVVLGFVILEQLIEGRHVVLVYGIHLLRGRVGGLLDIYRRTNWNKATHVRWVEGE